MTATLLGYVGHKVMSLGLVSITHTAEQQTNRGIVTEFAFSGETESTLAFFVECLSMAHDGFKHAQIFPD